MGAQAGRRDPSCCICLFIDQPSVTHGVEPKPGTVNIAPWTYTAKKAGQADQEKKSA